jgi:hypothetical protein
LRAAAFQDKVTDEGGDGDTGAADAAECNDGLQRAVLTEEPVYEWGV